MKKKFQVIISIVSFILICFFSGSAFAQDECAYTWSNYPDCVAGPDGRDCQCLYGERLVSPTEETERTKQAINELYTMEIRPTLGFPFFPSVFSESEWNGSCYEGSTIANYYFCLDGSYSFEWFSRGNWNVVCGQDTDGDEIPDSADNCPSIPNTNNQDSDLNGIGDACDDCPDMYEPDDNTGLAFPIALNTIESRCLHYGDRDYFSFSLSTLSEIVIDETLVGYGITFVLYDSDGVEITASNSHEDPLVTHVLPAGDYYVKAEGAHCAWLSLPASYDYEIYLSTTELSDSDNDGVADDSDNCPLIANPNQEDVDLNDIGDFCDADTVYGTVSGDIQQGVTVGIYRPSCGGDLLVAETMTDSEGYYAFGNLETGWHTILPEISGYTFFPDADYPSMPQIVIQSFDFTGTAD